jgi:hypothetical protein
MGQFNEIVKNKQAQKDERVKDLMDDAERMTKNLKDWWNKDYEKQKSYPKPKKVADSAVVQRLEEVVVVGYASQERRNVADSSRESDIQEVRVRGIASVSKRSSTFAVQALSGRVAGIEIKGRSESEKIEDIINPGRINMIDIASKAEYMKFFNEAKNPEMMYQVYLKTRKNYENLPQYYFDVSQLLLKNNDKKLGLKVLSSIADLDKMKNCINY